MILADKVRTYIGSPKSKPGWQVADYRNPYPRGTAALVLADASAAGMPDRYYIVPIAEIRRSSWTCRTLHSRMGRCIPGWGALGQSRGNPRGHAVIS
jgi:hypothetical protein